MSDLTVCFVLTVTMLRSFILEGYLVSTGSMAPALLGFHKRVRCPSCDWLFAFGVRFTDSGDGQTAADASETARATCPNCGQINIDVSDVPRNHGDQLLVHRHVFDLRPPRRWEPVVFRNPADPEEAYVKRVVGLPGERIRIHSGDVYINGRIARKDLTVQRDMRIPVSDLAFLPDSDLWELPWQLDGNWDVIDEQLVFDSPGNDPSVGSLTLRPWRWHGGQHVTEVALPAADAHPDWDEFLRRFDRIPVSWTNRLEYDEQRQRLRCRGVMPEQMQRDLIRSASGPGFRRAVYRLAARSHLAPLTDRCGYNPPAMASEHPITDLMLDVTISMQQQPREMRVQMPVADDVARITIIPATGEITVRVNDQPDAVRQAVLARLPAEFRLEVSGFDRRLLVAVDGDLPFRPLDLPGALPTGDDAASDAVLDAGRRIYGQQNRLTLAFSGGRFRLETLRLYRDVYYTEGRGRHAVERDCRIRSGSYFVLGDNSPVSFDSRSWEDPFVPHRLLTGKPFLVHLPSRPGRIRFGSREMTIRLPDFQRIRYIP